ncbi:MAG: xanthine dehydrogenase family protein molybdopterin-binding subunit [Phycisphaerales bacterium JB039]
MSIADQIPTVMPTQNRPQNLGASMDDDTARLDGVAKVTGKARYGRDVYPKDALFAAFVRCPYGAGELSSSDREAALAVPGVLEVEIDGERGNYDGHNIGHIVAESKSAMGRGLRALNAQWRPRNLTTTIEENIEGEPEPNDSTRQLLERADHVHEAVYSTPVQTHSPLETHGASIDFEGDRVIAYVSTQGTFSARDGLGDALGMPESQYEVRCEYIGGGFGSKLNGAGKEGALAARLAVKYKRPTWCFTSREEDHLDTGNRPSSRTVVKVGFNNDGEILGGMIQTYGGVGVSRGGGGVGIPSGQYRLGEIDKRHEDVGFNAGAPRPFRAPGRPQGVFAEELMLDEIATAAGVDPLELRLRLDTSEVRRQMLSAGADRIGWGRRQPTGSQTGARRRGFGIGACSWGRFPANAEAEVIVHPDGSVELLTGTQDIGTGQRTAMAVVVAEYLGIPLHHVQVRIGNSRYPIGPASGGSMTAHNTAPAVMVAAEDAKGKLLSALADREGGDASEYAIADGVVTRNNARICDWGELCQRIATQRITGRGDRATGVERHGGEGTSDGVQFAEVVIDTETGIVRPVRIIAMQACGKVICRKTAESQIIGGVTQGVSYALFENKILDRRTGSMVNPNLEQYKIAGARDVPHIEPVLWTEGQTGVRSLGEPPTIPTAGAIACAVFNAIGAPVRNLPITPDKVLAALEGGAA